MKKYRKRRMLLLSLILLILSGCNNSIDKTESTTMESENSLSVETQTEKTEIIAESEEPAKKTLENVRPEFEPAPWQTAYADYINDFWLNLNQKPDPYFTYSLIYLDDDEIPELFISTSSEAGGEIVATYYDGGLQTQQLSRKGSIYIERSGLIYTSTGHMDYYPTTIRKLEDGKFSNIGNGVKGLSVDEEGNFEIDENGNRFFIYLWEGETVSEEEFNYQIDEIFDREKGIRPKRQYTTEEMLSKLKTGACTSDGHRYELIQEDVFSWKEAQKCCKKKGGYLATITSPDEQDTIAAQIAKENKKDISFYVGYRNSEYYREQFYKSRWINADGSFIEAGFPYGLWSYAAPDYESIKDEWDMDHQNCGLVKYYDSTNQIYLFDAPEKLLKVSPEYTGKMGYICEFDE